MKKLNSKFFILFLALALFSLGGIFLLKNFTDFGKLKAGIEACCGNGRLDYTEVCDPTMPEADWIASIYATNYTDPNNLDSADVIDGTDYNIMISLCRDDCTMLCGTVPAADLAKINKGCYGDNMVPSKDPCQKGQWQCDEKGTVDLLDDEVACVDIYADPTWGGTPGNELFDYCCVDAGSALPAMTFNKIRIPNTATCGDPFCKPWGSGCNFAGCTTAVTCDDICRDNGEICIGVGLMDVSLMHCVYIIHNIGPVVNCDDGVSNSNCQNPGNLTTINCRNRLFALTTPTCAECYDSDLDGFTEGYTFHVGEAVCYCQ